MLQHTLPEHKHKHSHVYTKIKRTATIKYEDTRYVYFHSLLWLVSFSYITCFTKCTHIYDSRSGQGEVAHDAELWVLGQEVSQVAQLMAIKFV